MLSSAPRFTEIEELAKTIDSKCNVQKSGCLGLCRQAPAVLVVKNNREYEHVRVREVEKSAAIVEQAVGKAPRLDDPGLVERLSDVRATRVREQARQTYKSHEAATWLGM